MFHFGIVQRITHPVDPQQMYAKRRSVVRFTNLTQVLFSQISIPLRSASICPERFTTPVESLNVISVIRRQNHTLSSLLQFLSSQLNKQKIALSKACPAELDEIQWATGLYAICSPRIEAYYFFFIKERVDVCSSENRNQLPKKQETTTTNQRMVVQSPLLPLLETSSNEKRVCVFNSVGFTTSLNRKVLPSTRATHSSYLELRVGVDCSSCQK